MADIFMVHSVLAVGGVRKVTRDLGREDNSSDKREQENSRLFADVLQQEVDEMRMDSLNCQTVTYGIDRKIHHFEYRAREYRY